MRVERSVGEALPVVLSKELAVAQADVVDLVPRAAAVGPLPLLRRHLSLPEKKPRQDGYRSDRKFNFKINCGRRCCPLKSVELVLPFRVEKEFKTVAAFKFQFSPNKSDKKYLSLL